MKRIGVLTSGGDAPGMNAAIRAVVRSAIAADCSVLGFRDGFAGLLDGRADELGARDVGGIIQGGGTLLGSSRSDEFKTDAGQQKALRQLETLGVEGLIIIGGNGTQTGSHALWRRGFPIVGVASTIDNDLFGTEPSIGVDTALNIALEAIDRLKTTASSHHRAFLVEVMGRDCGFLALMAGIAGGAEAVSIPEVDLVPEVLAGQLHAAYERGKPHALVVVAEGAHWNGRALTDYFIQHQQHGFEIRLTTLGHVQRGGAPTASDRLLGSNLGFAASRAMLAGQHGVLVGQQHGAITTTPLDTVVANKKPLDLELLHMAGILSM